MYEIRYKIEYKIEICIKKSCEFGDSICNFAVIEWLKWQKFTYSQDFLRYSAQNIARRCITKGHKSFIREGN